MRTERGLSGKREIIKEKSKGFLRIKQTSAVGTELPAAQCTGWSGHPKRERILSNTQSVNTHGMPKDKVSSGQSIFTAGSSRKGWNPSRPKVSASPAVPPHSTQCPGKALSTHSVLKHSLTELLDLLKKQELFHELRTKVVSSRAHGASG